jgi:hypothetical protein
MDAGNHRFRCGVDGNIFNMEVIMDQIKEMQDKANRVAYINSAINKSSLAVAEQFVWLYHTQGTGDALRYLASLCATVIGNHADELVGEQGEKAAMEVLEVQMGALGRYILSPGQPIVEIDNS